jgi:hypothetical protein
LKKQINAIFYKIGAKKAKDTKAVHKTIKKGSPLTEKILSLKV